MRTASRLFINLKKAAETPFSCRMRAFRLATTFDSARLLAAHPAAGFADFAALPTVFARADLLIFQFILAARREYLT
ncbi:MAG TPA: hypothetical protein VJZ26_13830 [Blastocatellia bacterium]|nr:hypothetical protein [Blastocatellia bacterium]